MINEAWHAPAVCGAEWLIINAGIVTLIYLYLSNDPPKNYRNNECLEFPVQTNNNLIENSSKCVFVLISMLGRVKNSHYSSY